MLDNLTKMFQENKNMIGLCIVSMIVMYVIYRVINIQNMMIEGLENKDSSYKDIINTHKKCDIKNKEIINIKEQEQDHYDSLAALHDRVSSEIAVKILNNKDSKNKLHKKNIDLSEQAIDVITQINALHNFRDAIESTMDFVEETNKNN